MSDIDRAAVGGGILAVVFLQSMYMREYIASPLFIIGLISGILYVYIPLVGLYLYDNGAIGNQSIGITKFLIDDARIFKGEDAEKLVATFSISALGANYLFSTEIRNNHASNNIHPYMYIPPIILSSLMVIAVVYISGHQILSTLKSVSVTYTLFFIMLILISGKSRPLIAIALSGFILLLLVAASENKRTLLFLLFAGLFLVVYYEITLRKMILFVVGAILLALIILMTISSREHKTTFIANIQETIGAKILRRQVVTNKCFLFVVKEHFNANSEHNHLYFLAGLIPRIIWKDKPSISNGAYYEKQYCNSYYENSYYYTGHSSSITLLGEPIIKAGKIGLFIDISLLIVSLAWITRKAHQKGNIGLATLGAMTPWLVDFDQDFTLYVANAVKFFLCLLPALFWAHSWEKRLGMKHEPTNRPDS